MSNYRIIIIFLILLFLAVTLAAGEQFIYDSKNKKDPFIPLVTSDGYILSFEPLHEAGDIRLEGIIYDNNSKSFAIINGQVMGIGDKIGSFEILNVYSNGVEFLQGSKKIRIEIKED